MSSKSDADNRANQLNPNNSAYYNSRGQGRFDDADDWDESSGPVSSPGSSSASPWPVAPWTSTVFIDCDFLFVGYDGRIQSWQESIAVRVFGFPHQDYSAEDGRASAKGAFDRRGRELESGWASSGGMAFSLLVAPERTGLTGWTCHRRGPRVRKRWLTKRQFTRVARDVALGNAATDAANEIIRMSDEVIAWLDELMAHAAPRGRRAAQWRCELSAWRQRFCSFRPAVFLRDFDTCTHRIGSKSTVKEWRRLFTTAQPVLANDFDCVLASMSHPEVASPTDVSSSRVAELLRLVDIGTRACDRRARLVIADEFSDMAKSLPLTGYGALLFARLDIGEELARCQRWHDGPGRAVESLWQHPVAVEASRKPGSPWAG